MSKLISVFGATGQQGGSVVRALLNNSFKVRALTRNTESENSKKLKSLGVEVVKSDISESGDAIKSAIKGSEGLFLVTDFWSHFDKEAEVGKKVANASLEAGVKHMVFSSLPGVKEITKGKIAVPHFDLKHEIELHMRDLSKKNPQFVSSFVTAPFYYQNFSSYFFPKLTEDGKTYAFGFPSDPNAKFPLQMGDVQDIGPVVAALMKEPAKYSGKNIAYFGEEINGHQAAEIISKVTGKTVKFNYIPGNVFRTFGFPGAAELSDMFEFYDKYGLFETLDTTTAPKLTKLTKLEDFLRKTNYKL